MSALSRILGYVTYLLIQSVCVFSFPGPGLLSPRQSSCDSLVCPPSLDNFVGGAGDLLDDVLGVGAGVAGWVIDKATGLQVPQPVEGEKPNNANAPVADPMGQPENLGIPHDQCTATSGSNPNDGSGQVSVNAQPCGPATLQLVWALNCKNGAENLALEVTLKGMDSEVFAVNSPDCPNENGVLFWVGKFMPEQIESIKKAAHVVQTVEPDIPVRSDFRTGSTGENLDPAQFRKDLTAVPLVEEFSLQKRVARGTRTVSVTEGVNPSLDFLSTAPGKQASDTYASFRPGYSYIKIILLEFGIIESHPEILHDSTPEDNFEGTCMASMIGSKINGAARGLHFSRSRRLTFVRISNQIWSFIAGIIEAYNAFESDKRTVIGYNLVIIPVGINLKYIRKELTPEVSLSRILDMIKRMVNLWQVVFVVAVATEKTTESSGGTKVVETYPALWGARLPIVVVGAVDIFTGENPPWSYQGPALTVSAPAQGYCLGQKPVGTAVASAYVGGLVAYFLSLPDVGAYLRGQGSVLTAVNEYLRRLAYSRSPSNPGALAVWNGIDRSKAVTTYSFWIGDPTQDVEVPKSDTSSNASYSLGRMAEIYTWSALRSLST